MAAIPDSNFYINPRPLNRFNVFRWHQVAQPTELGQTPNVGWLPCATFSDLCGQEYYAMPVADHDSLAFPVNVAFDSEEVLGLTLGMIQCCELIGREVIGTINYFMDGEEWDEVTAGDVLMQIVIGIEDYMPDGVFNFCLFDGSTGNIKYISNPFRNVTDEEYLCKTLSVQATGTNLGNWTPPGTSFPEAQFSFRIDGALFDNQQISNRSEYTRSDGTKRIQSSTTQDSSTLSLYWLDSLAHEGMAFIITFDSFALSQTTHVGHAILDPLWQYHYKPDGEYTRENYDGYGLSNATVKLLNQDVIVKTGSC